MLDVVLPILIFAALALALAGALRRIGLWRQGRAAPVRLLTGLAAMPRRYLVDLHHVVARDKVFANTHVATGGGFVAAAVLLIAVHGFGLESKVLAWALLVASAVMFFGALRVAAEGRLPFWSASVYDRRGRNVYSLSDRSSETGTLDFVVLSPEQMIEARKDPRFAKMVEGFLKKFPSGYYADQARSLAD